MKTVIIHVPLNECIVLDNANEEMSHANEGRSHANEVKSHANEGRSHANEVKSHANEVKSHANEGRSHANEGRSHAACLMFQGHIYCYREMLPAKSTVWLAYAGVGSVEYVVLLLKHCRSNKLFCKYFE